MTTNSPTYPAEHAEYLTKVEARTAAATEGDWGVYDQGTMVEIVAGLEENSTGYQCRRQIARLDRDPIDNIRGHADWDEDRDYQQLLADAEFAAKARADVPRLLALVAEQHQRLMAAEEQLRAVHEVLAPAGQPCRVPMGPDAPLTAAVGWLADRAEYLAWLADHAENLAAHLEKIREFRIPLKNRLGGYAELTVERGPGPYDDRWGVTDGATMGRRAWHAGAWHSISDLGPSLAYAWSMRAALSLAEEVAGIEGARLDREVRAIQGEQASTDGRPAGGAR
ncbi:hypothetical protein ACF1AE_21460 [Streptomyces sp. NPDC014986]|uniref:hypothetical protein n=1 Tax=Streptomyces sp. NPDC014986 TaxID=3364934 RepID=UPI0036FC45A1